MITLNYKIFFLKRTAKLNKETIKIFAIEILKEFGGLTLLSNLSVSALDDNIFKIICEEDSVKLVQVAFILTGSYLDNKFCFIQTY